ncbi:MAG: PA14 domain-containing protein [Candidatus Ranarchaeia archaeon]
MRQKKYMIIVLAFFVLIFFSGSLTHYSNQSFNPYTRVSPAQPQKIQDGGVLFEWWDTDWKYRSRVDIEATYTPLLNTSVPVTMNFTAALEEISMTGTIDENSIRVIEQTATSGAVIAELPSHLYKYSNWSATSNALGVVLIKLSGTTPQNQNRTLFIYFDTLDDGGKQAPTYTDFYEGWWEQYYTSNGPYTQFTESMFIPPTNLEKTTYTVNYNDGTTNNFPAGADGSSPDWNDFSGNYTGWLWISSSGNYEFATSSDDGSWLYINNTLVVDNGGDHSTLTRATTTYLQEGLHQIRVAWYENGGVAVIRVYWTPGSTRILINGTVVSTFKYSRLMDQSSPPTIYFGETTASYIVRVNVKDTGDLPVEDANVSIYDDNEQMIRTGLTDVNGNATFFLPGTGNYTARATYLTDYPATGDKIEVAKNWTFELQITDQGTVVDNSLTLPLADLTLHFKDLDGVAFAESEDEHTYIRIYNSTYSIMKSNILTDANGNITVAKIPTGVYNISVRFEGLGRQYLYGEIPAQTITASASMSANITLPLTSVVIRVLSYDSEAVDTATVTVTSQNYTAQVEAASTNTTGHANFPRILNGTWSISTTRDNQFGQTVSNSTVFSWQANPAVKIVNFPFTTLTIKVTDGTNPISGANVTVKTSQGGQYVTHGSTGGDGFITFTWIRNGTYNVNATFLGESDATIAGLPSHKKQFNLTISIVYRKPDTVLIFYNSTYLSVGWNDNFTFVVEYINRTGALPDLAMTNPEWLNFTVKNADGVVLFVGTWNRSGSSRITNQGNGNYTLSISTSEFGLNANYTHPYTILIRGHNSTYDDPSPIQIGVLVTNASTSLSSSRDSISVVWNKDVEVYFSYNDTRHTPNLFISGATLSYTVKGAGYTRTGTLIAAGNSSYVLDVNTADVSGLNLPSGTYTLSVHATKLNYQSQVLSISLVIQEVPTTISIDRGATETAWDDTQTVTVQYLNATQSILDAVVNATWSHGVVNGVYDSGNGWYVISIDTGGASNGSYTVTINAWKGNYTYQTESFIINITTRQTSITSVSPSTHEVTLDWTETAEFNVTYYDPNISGGISGASSIESNWTSVYFNWIERGNGIYTLQFEASIAPANYSVHVQILKDNYDLATIDLTINILIPVSMIPNGNGSIVSPVTTYYTHPFNMSVYLFNTYSPDTNITGASIEYEFATMTGSMDETSTPGIYNVSINERTLIPGDYIVNISITKKGVTSTTELLFLTVLPTPTDLFMLNYTANRYYTENLTYVVYWNNTLDLGPVTPLTNSVLTIYHESQLHGTYVMEPISGQPGYYSIQLNTVTDLMTPSANAYELRFTAGMVGFATPSTKALNLFINEVPTRLEARLTKNEVELGRDINVTLIVTYTELVLGRPLPGASLNATIAGTVYPLTDHGNGTYTTEIPIDSLEIDSYLISVHAKKQYYQTQVLSNIQLVVTELHIVFPVIGPVPMSTVIVGGEMFSLPILVFLGIVVYKRVTMPYPLKVINKAIKGIQKGKTVETTDLKIRNRDTVIKNVLQPEFESVGFQLPRPPDLDTEPG